MTRNTIYDKSAERAGQGRWSEILSAGFHQNQSGNEREVRILRKRQ